MSMKRSLLKITLAFSLMMLSLPSVVCAGYISIDSFESGEMLLYASNPYVPIMKGYDPTVNRVDTIGAIRRAVLTADTPSNALFSTLDANFSVKGALTFQSPQSIQSTAWLLYDGRAVAGNSTLTDPFGTGPQFVPQYITDFTKVGSGGSLEINGIQLIGLQSVNVSLYFRDLDTWAKVDATFTNIMPKLSIDFSSWSNQSPNFDFSAITGFAMYIDGLTGGSLSIGSISASGTSPAPVPEPSTYLLMGIGLLGAVVLRRRSKV